MPDVQHYIQRALDFARGMKLTSSDEEYRNSSALLAIHCAISYSDALRVGLGDRELASGDHRQASLALDGLLPFSIVTDRRGILHLQYLLSSKNRVAYDRQRLTRNDVEKLVTTAERFERWANNLGKQMQIAGWKNEDS